MRKFIALKDDVYYSIEQEGDKTRFYANKQGTGYETRKDVTPDVLPNKVIINEIIKRPTISSEMSNDLKSFLSELAKRFS
ncbi:MAG TPA: hypothetical protein DIC64_00705 [Alphaproteobacteria bacterium]|nr:hypothetical protein [Alphaproteobacteria bacterium]